MERVLVVEKNGGTAQPVVGIASGIGLGVDVCEGADEAVSMLKSCKYSSIFVDIDTTGRNPIEMVGAFKNASPGTSIITFTEQNHLELERGIRNQGVYYYIVGPANESELKEALEGAVRAGNNNNHSY